MNLFSLVVDLIIFIVGNNFSLFFSFIFYRSLFITKFNFRLTAFSLEDFRVDNFRVDNLGIVNFNFSVISILDFLPL